MAYSGDSVKLGESTSVIALYGAMGSGKSLTASLWRKYDKRVTFLDVDSIVSSLYAQDTQLVQEIVARVGLEVWDQEAKQLRRDYLREKLFSDSTLRVEIERLVHPKVRAYLDVRCKQEAPGILVVVELPLAQSLDEGRRFDVVIEVRAHKDQRLARVLQRGIAKDVAVRIFNTQHQTEHTSAFFKSGQSKSACMAKLVGTQVWLLYNTRDVIFLKRQVLLIQLRCLTRLRCSKRT